MDARMKEAQTTEDRVRGVFRDSLGLNLDDTDLTGAARLDELVGFDSAAAIVFVAALENEFGITLEGDRLNLEFLGDPRQIASYIDNRTGQ